MNNDFLSSIGQVTGRSTPHGSNQGATKKAIETSLTFHEGRRKTLIDQLQAVCDKMPSATQEEYIRLSLLQKSLVRQIEDTEAKINGLKAQSRDTDVEAASTPALIKARVNASEAFGTGFVFAARDQNAYVLTCSHVIDNITDTITDVDALAFSGSPAKVFSRLASDILDMTVLETVLSAEMRPVPVSPAAHSGMSVTVLGYRAFDQFRLLRPLSGKLTDKVFLEATSDSTRVAAWDIVFDEELALQPGYSGAPVFADDGKYVVGIVAYRVGQGKKGVVIDISHLPSLWKGPSLFIATQPMAVSPPRVPSQVAQIKTNAIEKRIQMRLAEYQAIMKEIDINLNPDHKVLLEARAAHIEADVKKLEEDLLTVL